jgi:Ulp1 family protease
VSRPSSKSKWLVPALVPDHWILLEISWSESLVRVYDSLPKRPGAEQDEQDVRKDVTLLFEILRNRFEIEVDFSTWKWCREKVCRGLQSRERTDIMNHKRPQRQRNGHDCGVFAFADMASIILTGTPSPATQEDVGELRQEMWTTLRHLDQRVERPAAEEFVGQQIVYVG